MFFFLSEASLKPASTWSEGRLARSRASLAAGACGDGARLWAGRAWPGMAAFRGAVELRPSPPCRQQRGASLCLQIPAAPGAAGGCTVNRGSELRPDPAAGSFLSPRRARRRRRVRAPAQPLPAARRAHTALLPQGPAAIWRKLGKLQTGTGRWKERTVAAPRHPKSLRPPRVPAGPWGNHVCGGGSPAPGSCTRERPRKRSGCHDAAKHFCVR